MIVAFASVYAVSAVSLIPTWSGVLDTVLCIKVCQ